MYHFGLWWLVVGHQALLLKKLSEKIMKIVFCCRSTEEQTEVWTERNSLFQGKIQQEKQKIKYPVCRGLIILNKYIKMQRETVLQAFQLHFSCNIVKTENDRHKVMQKVHEKMTPKVTDISCATFCISSHVTFICTISLVVSHFQQMLYSQSTALKPTESIFSPSDYFSQTSCLAEDFSICLLSHSSCSLLVLYCLCGPVQCSASNISNSYSKHTGTTNIMSFYLIPLMKLQILHQ